MLIRYFDTRKWRILATNLRLKDSSMNTIMRENRNNVRMCIQLAITDWLKLNCEPSWRKLAKAVRPLNGNIFEKIVSMYPGNIAS